MSREPFADEVDTRLWYFLGMVGQAGNDGEAGQPVGSTVGLRELRHRTSAVIERVRRGETVDVTDYGRLVARIVPAEPPQPSDVLARLAAAGRLRRATRPGYRPATPADAGGDRLTEDLAESRAGRRW